MQYCTIRLTGEDLETTLSLAAEETKNTVEETIIAHFQSMGFRILKVTTTENPTDITLEVINPLPPWEDMPK